MVPSLGSRHVIDQFLKFRPIAYVGDGAGLSTGIPCYVITSARWRTLMRSSVAASAWVRYVLRGGGRTPGLSSESSVRYPGLSMAHRRADGERQYDLEPAIRALLSIES